MKPEHLAAARACAIATWGALAASLLALAAGSWWFADLATHFRVQYFVGALGTFALFTGMRWRASALAALATVALNAAPVYATFAPTAGRAAPDPAAPALRIAVANVLYLSSDAARVQRWARENPVDVLVLVEVTRAWRDALGSLRELYPHEVEQGVTRRRGVLVLSRWPLTPAQTVFPQGMRGVGLATDVSLPGGVDDAGSSAAADGERRVRLLAVHASWPLGPQSAAMRQGNLATVSDVAGRSDLPLIVTGDLNVSPFSPHFSKLLERGRLRNALEGRWLPTWPIHFMPVGIQIDHVLTSPSIAVAAVRRGPFIGSDHLPLIAELRLP